MTLRERIVLQADLEAACNYAERSANAVNAAINEVADPPFGMNIASQMVCRALVAKAILEVAAQFLSDYTKLPLPECAATIRGLVDDPPPEITGDVIRDNPDLLEQLP